MCELMVIPPQSFTNNYWKFDCIKYNHSRTNKDKIVSVTLYEYCTNDIDLKIIDDYRDGIKKAKKHLIKITKKFGKKTIEKV